MKCLHIITPVKDSIDSTLDTVKAIMSSDIKVPFTYTIYNDFSTPENTLRLEEASKEYGFQLVNLSDLTDHPSPNYLLVLQKTQQEAIEAEAGLLIVESDVTVQPHTLQAFLLHPASLTLLSYELQVSDLHTHISAIAHKAVHSVQAHTVSSLCYRISNNLYHLSLLFSLH